MKVSKTKITAFLFCLFLLITNSCNKDNVCYRCVLGSDIEEFCKNDYKTSEDFENTKELMEMIGYDCRRKYK